MICFLARLFLKNHDDTDLMEVRQGYGIISGVTGIAFNVFLFIIKLMAGILSGSIAIVGDAINNLSDAASSIVTLVGFKLAGGEADEKHPFGHGRVEYIAGLIVSLFIIITGVEVVQKSVNSIFHPDEVVFNAVVAVILGISIFVKMVMFQSNLQASVKIGSVALKTTAMDSISDVFTTIVVLIGSIVSHYTGLHIDGFMGVLVGFFIIKAGYEAARDTISPLLGEPPSKEFLEEIKETALAHDEVLGVHDIIVHNYGPGRIIMSLHVEVPADRDIIVIHDIIDDIENELRQKYHCVAVIHMDPVVFDDKLTSFLKEEIREIVKNLDPKLDIHDFRLIHKGENGRKVSFDVSVPYGFKLKDDEIIEYITTRVSASEFDVDFDITIDKENL
jgi:cation diffusion facilitator family transporter